VLQYRLLWALVLLLPLQLPIAQIEPMPNDPTGENEAAVDRSYSPPCATCSRWFFFEFVTTRQQASDFARISVKTNCDTHENLKQKSFKTTVKKSWRSYKLFD
jgi:hypothetical protein